MLCPVVRLQKLVGPVTEKLLREFHLLFLKVFFMAKKGCTEIIAHEDSDKSPPSDIKYLDIVHPQCHNF